jgi:CubicO group peptidase (beta-lactamase class C family)
MARTIILFVSAFAISLITILGIQPAFAQETAPRTLNELKARLETQMQKQHIAGMMLAIVNKDSILFTGGFGYSDLEKKTSVTDKHLFRGSSITKLFVALGILNLIKDGKLSVKSKLKDIAGEIPFENKWETASPVTIEQLMEHTTGFSDKSPFEEYNFSGKQYTGIEAVKVFEKFMVSKWKPGERHSYSGVNYAILDYIIEKVSGKPTREYLQQKVFRPLGMPYANVNLTDDDSGKFSKGYVWKEDHFQQVPHQPAFNAGYSSLNISALDFAYALKAYLNDFQTPVGQFLSKDILEDSEIPHTYLSARAGLRNSYAYGNELIGSGEQVFRGHRGAIGGYLSAFLYNRKLGLGYAFALNTHNEAFYQYADHLISQFVLQHTEKPSRILTYPVNKSAVNSYLGYYRLSNPSQLYTGFFESLTNTFKVEPAGNDLDVQIISRGSMLWQAVDHTGLKYKDKYATNSQILFLKDSDNNPVIVDGTLFFEKTTVLGAWAPIVLFAVSIFVLISTVAFGVFNFFFFIIKKIPQKQVLIRLLPAISTVGLLIILLSGTQLFDHMREATSMNGVFLSWLLGKWLFVLCTPTTVILLIHRWKLFKSKLLKIYLVLAVFSSCYLLIILLVNNWI